MEQITENFKRSEFACKCGCGKDDIKEGVVEILQDLRDYYGFPITITSGVRCKVHNEAIGGAKASKHMEGIAADFVVKGVSPDQVYAYLTTKYPGKYGIGNYPTFNHIDTRDGIWRKEK